jgi:uncharacterized protein (DUF427 family)
VHTLPRADPAKLTTYCPYKGDAAYYSLTTPGGDVQDAIWYYESPYPAVAQIAGHVAFYADRVSLSVGERDAAEVG